MPDQAPRITPGKKPGSTFEDRKDSKGREFYKSYKWRKFRDRVKRSRRKKDERKAAEIYPELANTTFASYLSWMKSDNPLCDDCLKEGYIRQGNVADHDVRIRAGGAKFDPDNIVFRCHPHHNRKSGKEAHE